MELREYQQRAVDKIRELVDMWPSRVACQAPTGAGKTHAMAELLKDPVPQLLVTHRRVILDQLSRELTKAGVEHGIRAAGVAPNLRARVQLAMLQSDVSRSLKSKKWPLHEGCRRIHIDEIHTVKSTMAQKLIAAYPGASVIGWTATPREIGHVCDHLVVMASVPELLSLGFLCPPVVFTPTGPDVSRLETMRAGVGGDYSPRDVDAVLPRNVILGYVHEHLLGLNPTLKPTVLFAGGVPQSLFMAQELTKRGVPSAHVDGKQIWFPPDIFSREINTPACLVESSPTNRAELFRRLRMGEIKVVCNRFVLREGWNFPAIEHVVLATSFGSRTTFVQACGRGLRPAPGKVCCTYQDHGANFWRFPPLDSDEPWDMTTKESTTLSALADDRRTETPQNPEPIVCPECSCLRVSGPACPHCGHRHQQSARWVMQLNGTLKRVEGRLYKPRRIKEQNGDAEVWKRAFWAARKHSPKRSLRQVYSWTARQRNWKWLPRDLPLMPPDDRQELWSAKVGEIPLAELR